MNNVIFFPARYNVLLYLRCHICEVKILSLFKHQIIIYKLLIIAIALIRFSVNLFAQDFDCASATAEIVAAISITKDVDMNFGLVVSSGSAGTVELGTDGSRTPTNVTLQSGGNVSTAEFTVSGEDGYTYNVILPSSVTIISGTDGMIVDDFISNPTEDEGDLTGGTETLFVGATLNVGINQPSGVYVSEKILQSLLIITKVSLLFGCYAKDMQ